MSKDLEHRITAIESSIVNYETELNRIKSLMNEYDKFFLQMKKNQKNLKESEIDRSFFESGCRDCNDVIDEECY